MTLLTKNRRTAVMASALSLMVFAMTGVFTDGADATEPPQRRSVPFKVLYNHDGTYMKTCVHPWRQPGRHHSITS